MKNTRLGLTLLAIAAGSAATTFAQGIPTSQPKFLHIFRETVKAGRSAEHSKWEAGWPAAFEKAKSKYNYLAITSVTGPAEAWFISPFASQAAYGDSLADEKDPVLGPELDRLSKGDAEFVGEVTAVQAVAMPDLSHGSFPDMSKVRFYEITTFRVKPGYYDEWVAATKAYKSAPARSAPSASWRTYEVVAGAPGGTYLVMSTVGSFADFDKMASEGEATWKNMTADESRDHGQVPQGGPARHDDAALPRRPGHELRRRRDEGEGSRRSGGRRSSRRPSDRRWGRLPSGGRPFLLRASIARYRAGMCRSKNDAARAKACRQLDWSRNPCTSSGKTSSSTSTPCRRKVAATSTVSLKGTLRSSSPCTRSTGARQPERDAIGDDSNATRASSGRASGS